MELVWCEVEKTHSLVEENALGMVMRVRMVVLKVWSTQSKSAVQWW